MQCLYCGGDTEFDGEYTDGYGKNVIDWKCIECDCITTQDERDNLELTIRRKRESKSN